MKKVLDLLERNLKNIKVQDDELENSDQENYILKIPEESNCPLCRVGSVPSRNGAHKCCVCGVPVHALPTCSKNKTGQEDIRVCFTCSTLEVDLNLNIGGNNFTENINISEERNATESWNRSSQKKSSSYLIPNAHLRHLDLKNSRSIKSLPMLKNGSRSKELKSCTSNSVSGRIILSNTCAFDSLASLIMVNI